MKNDVARMTKPSPTQIKKVRKKAGLTQSDAANLVYRKLRTWQEYESGERGIDMAVWELFLIKSVKHN